MSLFAISTRPRSAGTSLCTSVRVISLLLLLGAAGCSSAPDTPAQHAQMAQAVGELRPPSELGPDFQWRQQVTAKWPNGTRGFDAVLSKEGNKLVLVGLGPMDTPGFVLTVESSGELTVENHTQQPIPFDPKFVLLDVQRAFYPWFPSPLKNGQRTVTSGDDVVTETWSNGNLDSRIFTRVTGKPAGTLVVSYSGWSPGNRAPRRAVLQNGWFGYTLTIETVDQTSLD